MHTATMLIQNQNCKTKGMLMKLKFVRTEDYINPVTSYHHKKDIYQCGNYTVNDLTMTSNDGEGYRRLGVINHEDYLPEIYPVYNHDEVVTGFSIAVRSREFVDLDEYKKFISSQHEALEVVKALMEKFVQKV